jgi:hypothetical protein
VRAGGGRDSRWQLRLSRPVISALVTSAAVAMTLTALGFAVNSMAKKGAGSESGGLYTARFAPNAAGHAATKFYSFSYPAQSAELAQPLVDKSDDVFNDVAAYPGMANNASIDVELTDQDRLLATIVAERHLFAIQELADIETLAQSANRNLQYPLGAALIDVFVERYGLEAPSDCC